MSRDDEKVKLGEIDGWIEDEEEKPKTGMPAKCPKCGSDLWKTNAMQLLGIIWVGCRNPRCRWCEVYGE